MKKYFKILAIAAFALSFVAKSYSQTTTKSTESDKPTQTIEQKTTSIVDEMTKVATLTSDEISKIIPLVTEFLKQKDIDEETNKADKEKLTSARKARMDKLTSQVKLIVTADQYTQLENYWKNKKARATGTKATEEQTK